jgi:hypothetical protein
MDLDAVVSRWELAPHPEGGYFKETYRCGLTAVPPGWPGRRSLATSIMYLLPAGQRSAWHRVRGEELWLWQHGAPMVVTIGDTTHALGPGPGQDLQVLVPAGAWQTATPAGEAPGWSLVACVVAPGFDFADFELRQP